MVIVPYISISRIVWQTAGGTSTYLVGETIFARLKVDGPVFWTGTT